MLELNKWFFVLAINFLILFFILNVVLFKPLLKIFTEREDTVKGALDAAKDLSSKREEGIARLNSELAESRSKAKEIFEALKSEGVTKQKEELSTAEAEAGTMIEQAKTQIRSEAEKARQALKADVEKFSDEIVGKLVKA